MTTRERKLETPPGEPQRYRCVGETCNACDRLGFHIRSWDDIPRERCPADRPTPRADRPRRGRRETRAERDRYRALLGMSPDDPAAVDAAWAERNK